MKRVLLTVVVLLVSLPSLAQPKRRVLDKKFWLAIGTAVALTVTDLELSQHCIQRHACRERNPLLGQSRGRAYAVNAAILVPVTIWTYRMKKDQDRNGRRKNDLPWWVPSVINISSHGVGVGVGLYSSARAGRTATLSPGLLSAPKPDTNLPSYLDTLPHLSPVGRQEVSPSLLMPPLRLPVR